MPKIIVTSRYIKLNSHKRFGSYIKYIATRKGVKKPIPKQETNRELDREIFMNCLDSRPNSHRLFSETDDPLVLDKVAKEVANHPGAISSGGKFGNNGGSEDRSRKYSVVCSVPQQGNHFARSHCSVFGWRRNSCMA